jgi:voltage-gated potassium channel
MPKGNYIFMLAGLLVLLLLSPALSIVFPVTASIFSQFALILVMIIGVWSLNQSNDWFKISIGLASTGLILTVIHFFYHSNVIYLVSLLCVLLFCVLSMITAMKHILFSGEITLNKIVGSVCIYLLIGVIWGLLYIFISYAEPGAFNGLAHENDKIWSFIYFSFVTLTTLGYGDISPAIPLARTLAYIEAIFGQFYLAVLVASLVSAHLAKRPQEK